MKQFNYKDNNGIFTIYAIKEKTELDYDTIPEVKALIRLGKKEGHKEIVIDFANIKYFNSDGLGLLIFGTKKNQLILTNLNQYLKRVIEITNTDQLFKIK